MPRSRSHTKNSLASSAMELFWRQGYHATSLDDLVKATGVSRHGIYGDYGGKQALLLACFEIYQDEVVTPAFCDVEQPGAGLGAIATYFDRQITRAEETGLPGPGCLVANMMTETAPHNDDIQMLVSEHNDRLQRGFLNVLYYEAPTMMLHKRDFLARNIVVFAQGLWSASRVTTDASILRHSVNTFLKMLSKEIRR